MTKVKLYNDDYSPTVTPFTFQDDRFDLDLVSRCPSTTVLAIVSTQQFNSESMKSLNVIVSIAAATMLALVTSFQARADIFSDINNMKRTIDGTRDNIQGAGSTLGEVGKMFGIGGNNQPTDTGAQALSIYADWYKTMSPMEKDVVSMLTTEYAEKGTLDFAGFKDTNFYKTKTIAERQKMSGIFFKFSEVAKNAPKEKFLALAFCINGGGNNCK